MEKNIKRIFSIMHYSDKMLSRISSIKGNPDFLRMLSEIPGFTEDMKVQVDTIRNRKTRGRPVSEKCPDEVLYLTLLVERLYESCGKKISASHKSSLKTCLSLAATRDSWLFDPSRSRHWIEVFSALELRYHIFSGDGGDDPIRFMKGYIDFYRRMNNRKEVPFYPRWISELCAMYTVYTTGLYSDYKELYKCFSESRERGLLSPSADTSFGKTDVIRTDAVIFSLKAYRKDRVAFSRAVSAYIERHPVYFVSDEPGNGTTRYRRFYCIIKEMLDWSRRSEIGVALASEEMLDIFCDRDADYSHLDEKIESLEMSILERCASLAGTGSVGDSLSLLVDKRAFIGSSGRIMITTDNYGSYRERSIEEIVDNVVRVLRITVAIITVARLESDTGANSWSIMPTDKIKSEVNRILMDFGLMPLCEYATDEECYVVGRGADWCLLMYIGDDE